MNRSLIVRTLGESFVNPVLVAENQSVRDIINLMNYKHKKCVPDYDRIAPYFWTGSIRSTAKSLFDFCKRYIPYEIETEELQTVRSPQKIISKPGDCKHYASFIAGVLDALSRSGQNIDWYYRFASYNPFDDTPGHVFVIIRQPNGKEIWIDPVLNEFDFHKDYQYALDKKVRTGTMSGISYVNPGHSYNSGYRSKLGLSRLQGYECVGATTAQTGQLIMKVSPALAAVPVIGWAAAAGGEVVGFFLSTFGSAYSTSTQVRWLDQLYEFYVVGNKSATSDNKVNEANVPTAQKWFALVLGVPVYDRLRFNSLAGKTGSPAVDSSLDARVKNYLSYPEVQKAGVTYDQAAAAANIAASLPLNNVAGAWRNQTAAPSVIAQPGSSSLLPGTSSAGIFAGMNPWIMFGLIGAALFFILSPKKHQYVKR